MTDSPIRDRIATANERTKLLAGFLNAIGLGLIGFGVIRPLSEIPASSLSATLVGTGGWFAAGLAFHALGHYFLGYMRKERRDDQL